METKNLLIKVILPVVLVLIVILSLLVIAQNKAKQTQQTQTQTTQTSGTSQDYEHEKAKDFSEKAKEGIKETRGLTGRVVKIFDPGVGEVRFLTVNAGVIDISKIDGIDFSQGQNNLPTVNKTYEVAVDRQTLFKKGDMDDIKTGDFIKATSVEGIHNVEKFTATEIKIIVNPKNK